MQNLFNGSPGIWIVLCLIIVAAVLACVELWRCREDVKKKMAAAWGDGCRWLALAVSVLCVINIITMPALETAGARAFVIAFVWAPCALWFVLTLHMWRSVLLVDVNGGMMMPRFYGVAWGQFNSPTLTCAPIPLNIVLGLLHSLYYFMMAGWRKVYADPRQAYMQGRKEAFAYVREQSKEPGWFERFAYSEYEVR